MADYKCSRCGRKECTKLMSIHTLPHTLCLHWKRFESEREKSKSRSASPGTVKNSQKGDGGDVAFESNKIEQFVDEKRRGSVVNQKEYRLRSMIIHSGTLSS